MRLFQNSGVYPAYRAHFDRLTVDQRDFGLRQQRYLHDRFGALHILGPVLWSSPDAFFTNGDDEHLQQAWAREHGLPKKASLDEILLSQIESHRTEVFYNSDPMRYGSAFVKRLPACVKHSIAWRAAPSPGADFSAFDLVVCNFPSILESYRQAGWKAAWFAPAYDPAMTPFAANAVRPVDVLFVGGYSRHHRQRAAILEAVAEGLGDKCVEFYLDQSRLTRLAESLPGRLLPLGEHRRPASIQRASRPPIFGLELYSALSRAKVVLNGAVDMAGEDRGNMRCFEAMGCGALMVSDAGRYPPGMETGKTMLTYTNSSDAVQVIRNALACPADATRIAQTGHQMLRQEYSKERQWQAFQALVAGL